MIHYFLLANIYALVFFGLYLLVFRNSKNHSWSRFYLLSSIAFSLLLPFIKLHFQGLFFGKLLHPIQTTLLPEFILTGKQNVLRAPFQYANGIQIIYVTICTLLLFRFIYSIIKLRLFLGKQSFVLKDGYRLGMNTGAGPASFGSAIIFPDGHLDDNILKHEIAHLQLKHHFDKMMLQLLRCFAFPVLVFHLMYNELLIVHEFEADECAHIDKEVYAKTLLAAHFNNNSIPLLQNFFHHPLKRRIMMLYKNKASNKARKSILITFSAITLSTALLLQSNGITLAQNKKDAQQESEKIFQKVDVVPEFPGGAAALSQFLAENIKYPPAAKKANREGRVVVQFVVDKDGSVTDIDIKRDIGKGCGKEAQRVIKMMPKWTPGLQDGKAVKVLYILPVTFRLA